MSEPSDTSFYEAFVAELKMITIMADMPAAAVVGECLRAAKRVQMALDKAAAAPPSPESEGT